MQCLNMEALRAVEDNMESDCGFTFIQDNYDDIMILYLTHNQST